MRRDSQRDKHVFLRRLALQIIIPRSDLANDSFDNTLPSPILSSRRPVSLTFYLSPSRHLNFEIPTTTDNDRVSSLLPITAGDRRETLRADPPIERSLIGRERTRGKNEDSATRERAGCERATRAHPA